MKITPTTLALACANAAQMTVEHPRTSAQVALNCLTHPELIRLREELLQATVARRSNKQLIEEIDRMLSE